MNTLTLKYVLVLVISVTNIVTNYNPVSAFSHAINHHHLHDGRDGSNDFSNQWIVHLDGSSSAADLLAMKLGYKNLGEVS